MMFSVLVVHGLASFLLLMFFAVSFCLVKVLCNCSLELVLLFSNLRVVGDACLDEASEA